MSKNMNDSKVNVVKPWGGRFKEPNDKLMERFSASITFDKKLYAYDIKGSIAHCVAAVATSLTSRAVNVMVDIEIPQ